MDRDTADLLPSFRAQVRKTFTYSSHDRPRENGGISDERTPLIGNGNGSATQNGRNEIWKFFFDSHDTPGLGNSKPWVKYPAHVWHVTKATLLSMGYRLI
ncbi:uncharacterized protein F4822DRAFT_284150 [Hypoxylon trugodes]|uniref:uncharacterized protein n=1 Tax=Hypoxylon trugodes TaxID=326681 RepID=UPI0021908F62|nr:uncharacterized protein F4822DRAFT_284150 [Hypoxylon trugodes]KAI1387490.1 hypothetical protein F4822DRAFT_284150 [Hypoxylon trugodes]